MSKLPIVIEPNEILEKKSAEIDRDFLLSKETQQLIKDMVETMNTDGGIGLAAPQIGKNIRIIIIGKEATENKKKNVVLVNPVWQKLNKKTYIDTEGCLSVPKTFGKVRRYKNIQVEAWDKQAKAVSFAASDFFARVIQHEVDHLEGILFIDKAKDIYTVD